jgi:hypothetical protein
MCSEGKEVRERDSERAPTYLFEPILHPHQVHTTISRNELHSVELRRSVVETASVSR